ncbi:Susd and RagB outer membrane lipoprotein [compost metagenome]
MQQWNVATGSYLADAVSKPTAYVDPKNPANNAAAVSTITVKWDGTASNEVKLERIITQKWIAIFPDGAEAWADFRRTGYPKLFTVANNYSGGTINTQTQIRRLPYPTAEYGNGNKDEVRKAVTLLGGPDNGGTRLWWDVNKANF